MNRVILASAGYQGRAIGASRSGASVGIGSPVLGAHVSANVGVGVPNDPLVTPSITTQSGSLLLANVARGDLSNFVIGGAVPHDNKGNPNYTQIGVTEAYSPPNNASATALYKLVGGSGGSGYQVSVAQGLNGGSNNDEVTILLVEIIGGFGVVQDFQWNEDTASHPTTSASVTTTRPAVLVAFWWGEDGASFVSATVDAGWTIVESVPVTGSAIQAAMAVRQVSAPGTYNITWTATPSQGAQMWIAAVQ